MLNKKREVSETFSFHAECDDFFTNTITAPRRWQGLIVGKNYLRSRPLVQLKSSKQRTKFLLLPDSKHNNAQSFGCYLAVNLTT
jgi:hypothetical protein